MENREQERARDSELDARIERILTGKPEPEGSRTGSEHVARIFARLTVEESPRLSAAARTRGLNALRAQAALKRKSRRTNPFAMLAFVPRWALVVIVALTAVLIADGVSVAAANSLPGTLLYPLKRIGESGQLLLQDTHRQRAQLWMNFATTRLDEAQRMIANGARVDPTILDAIDESIMHALSETADTRGSERVELLKQLTLLTIRQQEIVDALAHKASPEDRARLQQTARFLHDVADYSASDAALEPDRNPPEFLTPGMTPTQLPAAMPTPTDIPGRTSAPTETSIPIATSSPTAFENPSATETVGVRSTEPAATSSPLPPPTQPDETRAPQRTGEPEPTDEPHETDQPEPTDKPEPTEKPEPTDRPEPTDKPEPTDEPDETAEPDETESPEPTERPEPTDKPEPTDEPDETAEPDETREPKPTKTRNPQAALYYFFSDSVDSFEL